MPKSRQDLVKCLLLLLMRSKSPSFPLKEHFKGVLQIQKFSTKDFLRTDYIIYIPNALQELFLALFQEKKEVFRCQIITDLIKPMQSESKFGFRNWGAEPGLIYKIELH